MANFSYSRNFKGVADVFGVEGSPEYFKLIGASLANNSYAQLLRRQAA